MTLIDTPFRARSEAQHVARIHLLTPREEIQPAMLSALDELQSALQSQNIAPNGPWLTYHHRRPGETFDFDVCFPTGQPINPVGRVENAQIPAAEVLRTVFHGDYARLPAAWAEFIKWIDASGYKIRPGFFEVYTVGPEQNPVPDRWCTELNCPIADDHANEPQAEIER